MPFTRSLKGREQSEKHIHVARAKHMQAERETQEDAEKMTTKESR